MPSSYPLDTTGISQANLVANELHTLTEINAAPYRILIPVFAPFYLDNFALMHVDSLGTSTLLVPDVDYYHCLPYISAARSTGKMVYGGVTINNSIVNGTLKITYQTIGGDWTTDGNYIRERLIEKIYNPRTTVWDVVTDKQTLFPPTDHAQALDTVYGQQQLLSALGAITSQIAASAAAANSGLTVGILKSEKGAPSGVATLDSNGKLTPAQVPAARVRIATPASFFLARS